MTVKVAYKGILLEFDAPPTAEQIITSYKLHKSQQISKEVPSVQPSSIMPASPRQRYPLSFAQESLYFLNQLDPGNSSYTIQFALRLTGVLNLEVFHRALQALVNRHTSLRTTFDADNGVPYQIFTENLSLELPQCNLSSLPEVAREFEVIRLATEQAKRPFKLNQEPLLRLDLFKLSEREYILLLTLHHIISDGPSVEILARELGEYYAAFLRRETPALTCLPIQYPDFAVWQHEQLQEVFVAQEVYWKKKFAGNLPLLYLPTKYPHIKSHNQRGAAQVLVLGEELSKQLRAVGRKHGATVFMTLLTAFYTLLYRYTAQEDLIIGAPITTRHHKETESLIGCFINTLALRTNLWGNPTFSELLGRVRLTALEAYRHQDYPFTRLVKVINPERDVRQTPLFQVMMAFQANPFISIELQELKITSFELPIQTSEFDLILDVLEQDSEVAIKWQYQTELFDTSTITRMMGHFQSLLKGIVANPEQHLSDLPLLTAAEQHQLLVEWNNTQTDYPKDTCIHQLFEAQVERTPNAIAVIFENQQLTYQQLNHRANQLAHHLQKLGVGPEVLVGICVERSLEMVVGMLGILKAGGAYVPLDPAYPPERLAFMLEDASVGVLLTQARLVESIPKHQGRIVCLDTDWEIIERQSEENPGCCLTPENLAYVIYTSGSTGQPKGVLVAHSGLSNLVTAQIRIFNVQPNSRVLQFASLSFDASASEVVMALLAGATLVMGTRDSLLPGPNLIQLLRDFRVTTVTLPPSVLAVLPANELPALRTIIVAGEACSRDLVAKWSSGRRFFNGYGPTECTVGTTMIECTDSKVAPPIGRPLPNTQVYILDAQKQLVPIGVPGELYIGGVGVTRGYLNRPELTADRFILNPFSNDSGSRLYKTGDLVRYLPDGNIEFVGRIDNQVKIRGFRIELGEVETVLAQYPTVEKCVVTAREDIENEKRLVAYIISHPHQTSTVDELRRFLKQKLPDYMVPGAFVFLETLPLTPNGKIDRRALPAPEFSRPDLEETFVAPRTAVEEQLADIWTGVFKLEQVGIRDNFFALGGHSLLATQVISRLRQAFGIDLPLRTLFEAPTVAELGSRIDNIRWAAQQTSDSDTTEDHEEGEL
jgi:amino acid adenylation domain-containing protein